MSALIFNISPQHAFVATDTLATTPDGVPQFYTSKAYYVPHLRMIIAGTGYGALISRWFHEVNTAMLVDGVEELSKYAPEVLSRLWREFVAENPEQTGSTTIYQFGVSEKTGEIVAFVNRSGSEFKSEAFPSSGTAYKPSTGARDIEFSVDAIPEIMEAMRDGQAGKVDPAERIHIGGEIVLFGLTEDGFMSQIIHRFKDADMHSRVMRRTRSRSRPVTPCSTIPTASASRSSSPCRRAFEWLLRSGGWASAT